MQQGISLKPTKATSHGSAVKSVALATFRLLRATGNQVAKAPGVLQQAVGDVADAWHESAGTVRSKS